jgi:hypothetical protein
MDSAEVVLCVCLFLAVKNVFYHNNHSVIDLFHCPSYLTDKILNTFRRVSENRVLRRIFVPQREEVTEDLRKL